MNINKIFLIIKIIIKTILNSKKIYGYPSKNKIIILDSYSIRIIKYFLIPKESFTLLDLKRREIYVPIFIKSIFFIFKYGKYAYEVLFIKYVNPRIAITYIDNNHYYFTIFSFIKNSLLIMIQNGNLASNRKDIKSIPIKNRKCDYYFVLNNLSKNFFQKKCKIISNYIIAGSQEANINRLNFNTKKKIDEITLVSYFRKKDNYDPNFYNNFHVKPIFFIRNVLKKYLRNNKMKFNILLVSNENEEKEFFDKMFNSIKFHYIENDRNKIFKNSYKALNSNTIYIGDSKLLTECLGLGYKILFFSIRGHYINDSSYEFGWPYHTNKFGDFWLNYPNEQKAINILSNIINIELKDWRRILIKYKDFHHFNYENKNTIKVIKKLINN